MSKPWRLSLSDGLKRIAEGGLSASEWTRSLLERIDALDEKILAWAHVDRDGALAEARAIDERLASGEGNGPLGAEPSATRTSWTSPVCRAKRTLRFSKAK